MSISSTRSDFAQITALAALGLALAACSTIPSRPVVVVDRPVSRAPAAQSVTAPAPAMPAKTASAQPAQTPSAQGPASQPASAAPLASSATRPGHYTVKPGDTLVRIALDHGQNWRDLAQWNQIENPNLIEVGQVLRVAPGASAGVTTPTETALQRSEKPQSLSAPAGQAPAAGKEQPARSRPVVPESASGPIQWSWPASGPLLQAFDEQRNKGLDIGGASGDPVLAAADGQVIYAGSDLRGYGNLLILKHNQSFLSAYAHNQVLLVREDQIVKRGQKIAEMGKTDAERVQLHFEIRRDGKPVDPLKHLPSR